MGAATCPGPRAPAPPAPGDPRGECPAPASPSPTAPARPRRCPPPSLTPLRPCIVPGAPPGPASQSLVFSCLPPYYKTMSESTDQTRRTSCFAHPYQQLCASVSARFAQAPPGREEGPGDGAGPRHAPVAPQPPLPSGHSRGAQRPLFRSEPLGRPPSAALPGPGAALGPWRPLRR